MSECWSLTQYNLFSLYSPRGLLFWNSYFGRLPATDRDNVGMSSNRAGGEAIIGKWGRMEPGELYTITVDSGP